MKIEPHLALRLRSLLDATGSVIIVSSSWRLVPCELKEHLDKIDPEISKKIIGITPISKYRWRGDEIAHVVDTLGIERFVVLEDEPSDVCGDKCCSIRSQNVVHVDFRNGLSHADVMSAIRILKEEAEWQEG